MGAIWTIISEFFGGMTTQLITIAIVIAMIVGGYLYWQHLESKIANLTQQNTILTGTVQTQNQTISTLQKRFAQIQQDLNDLNKSYLSIDTSATNLAKQFEFGVVTTANKKTVETNLNQAYNSIFQNIMTQTSTFAMLKPGK